MKRYPLIAIAALLVVFGAKNALADSNYPAALGLYSGAPISTSTLLAAPVTIAAVSSTYLGNVVGETGRSGMALYDKNSSSSPLYWSSDSTDSGMQGLSVADLINCGGTQLFACYSYGSSTLPLGEYELISFESPSSHGNSSPYSNCDAQPMASCESSALGWVDFTVSGAVQNSPTITFYTPAPYGTTPDFSSWQLLAASTPADGTIYRFDVIYTQFGGSITHDDFSISASNFNPELLEIPKTHTLADGTSWYAQGFLFATTTTDADLAVTDPGDVHWTTHEVGTATAIEFT